MAISEAPPEPDDSALPEPGQAEPTRTSLIRIALLAAVVAVVGVQGGLPWLFIIGSIVAMIFLHELGHFLTAKHAGMKVTQFFLGFGPRIWSIRRGETEYGIKAIPAGAYVKVVGMYNLDEVDAADEQRTYRQKTYRQRVVMAAAGSTMHFLLALVLIYGVLVGVGRPKLDNWEVRAVSPGSSAEVAGLQPGDRLITINRSGVADWNDMRDVILPLQGQTVPIVFERNGVTASVEVTIGANPVRPQEGQLGVGPSFPPERVGPIAAVGQTVREFGDVAAASVKGMVQLFTPAGLGSFAQQVAQGRPEPSTDAAGSSSGGGGENRFLSIYGAARLGVDLTREGIAPALGFLAMLNLFIGMFNLIPLLPFDGGHIAIATYERVRELLRRDGRRYFTDVGRLLPLTYAVVALLVMIGLSSFYLDFVNPVHLP